MHNFHNLSSELKRYQEAKKAYFAHTITDDASSTRHVELRRAYDDAAHSVAFHADLELDMAHALPSSHPDFLRLLESIEQHPEPSIIEPDAAHWNAIGRYPFAEMQCIQNDSECPNPGWPIPCPKCNYCFQNPDELAPEPDENAAADSSDWTTAATEEDIQSWASDSRDLFDDGYDEDDWDGDWWYDDNGNWGPEDYDEEPSDDGSGHASRDPLSGKCYCPYCNSECAPDVCNVCHSELTPPAIDTEMRTDLPDEPPF